MRRAFFVKPKPHAVKITAAQLAGIRPPPIPELGASAPLGRWDRSTAFLAGFALVALAFPDLEAILTFGAVGAPHPAGDLLILLGVIALFGVFPVVVFQHIYLQGAGTRRLAWKRAASAVIALGIMFFATGVMKSVVGYDEKIEKDRHYAESSPRQDRSPASVAE